jgi:small subunit ribosomal protein S6
MEKYEIMLVINPELDKTAATKELNEILSLINNNKDFKITDLGKKELAYTINKNSKEFTHGLYLLLNFDSETPVDFNEFNRLSLLDKNVLRHLIINLTKDYG